MNIAKRYINCGIQIEDLIGEGTLGLHKTIEKFDPKRGLAFSTYATWWIKQSIRRALTDKSRIIRVPVYMHTALTAEKIDKTNKVEAKKAETRERAKKIMEGVFSLNEEHMKSRVDKRKSIVENIGLKEAVEIVKNYMNKFSERKKRIVRHRLGGEVFNVDELTLNQLSEKLSLSRERVRQLQNEAVLALKDELTRKGF